MRSAAKPASHTSRLKYLACVLPALAGAVAAYVRWLRPWQMHWGATAEEIAMVLPGDDIVPQPTWNATRAVTVDATPEQVWPWLVQIGWGRAGWYGYDWADNGFKPSVWEILPEHQHLEVGKDFPMSPWTAMYCRGFEPNRWMLWRGGANSGTWLWYLRPLESGQTRLLTRMRDRYRWTNPVFLPLQLAVDVFDFPFMRKCLLGIKARAERASESATPPRS